MIPWELLDSVQVPGNSGELRLYKRGREFSIRVNGCELMNSSAHGSEDALAELACAKAAGRPNPKVLIGGLGMGYTLAAALKRLGSNACVVVAELAPAVIEWNRKLLAALAGHPLQDKRCTIREGDVAVVIKEKRNNYDAILLDVDNGPEGLARKGNNWLYAREGPAYTRAVPVAEDGTRSGLPYVVHDLNKRAQMLQVALESLEQLN